MDKLPKVQISTLPTGSRGLLSISQAAKLLGVSAVTLRYWEKKGLLIGQRSQGGIRKYRVSYLKDFIQAHPELLTKGSETKPVSIKKVEGHFLLTNRMAVLATLCFIAFGILISLTTQLVFLKFTQQPTTKAVNTQPIPTTEGSKTFESIKTDLGSNTHLAQSPQVKDSLQVTSPEVKGFSRVEVEIEPLHPNSELLDGQSLENLDLGLPLDQEIDCTLI